MIGFYIILGIAIGGSLVFILMKSTFVSKKNYDQANEKLIRAQENELNYQQKIEELKLSNLELMRENALIQKSKEELLFTNAELNAHYKNLQENLENQKADFVQLQETNRLQFEKTANQILEQKSEKFTQLNQNQLKLILEPFQEKINELKNTVNETYDKESKERFSLGEKVRELKDLNQQISEDAKKLTRALKGESKTQGNWGEMILESILEKSGLRKNQEYFMEHELRDENNKAIFSEFSGKKMRPDAVVKYPDNRNVIIDSKVSLTAFVEMTDETDAEIFAIKQSQHLQSVKNHIKQLSQKAYDDFDKSLDFVMMFIPSEAAYMTALQSDPNLWNFAYDKRILLLSPTNLITSLKLVQDLWKREHQNRNAMEIADRGAKLYDKFVGFVDNLERIGKNIDQAKNSYNEAFKQLSSGNDNLIVQTQKLKGLGIKNKKNLPQGLGEED
jgi:DNA recombination protein RmuC